MKKIIMFAVIALAVISFIFSTVRKSNSLTLKSLTNTAFAECETTVTTNGGIITVTVCNRKTTTAQLAVGIYCGTEATSSCSFTNVCG